MSKLYNYQGLQEILVLTSGILGTIPIATGAAEKTASCHAFEAWENTTIRQFKDENGVIVTTGWESKVILAGNTAYFGQKISKFTVTVGGYGQVYKYE